MLQSRFGDCGNRKLNKSVSKHVPIGSNSYKYVVSWFCVHTIHSNDRMKLRLYSIGDGVI